MALLVASRSEHYAKIFSLMGARVSDNSHRVHQIKALQVLCFLIGDLQGTDAGERLSRDLMANSHLIKPVSVSRLHPGSLLFVARCV